MSTSESEPDPTTSTESDDDDDDDDDEDDEDSSEETSDESSSTNTSTNFRYVLKNRKMSKATCQIRKCISAELLQFLTIKNSIPKLQNPGPNSAKYKTTNSTFKETLAKKVEVNESPNKELVDWGKLIPLLVETKNTNLLSEVLAEIHHNYNGTNTVPFKEDKDMSDSEKTFADFVSQLLMSHLPEKQTNEPTGSGLLGNQVSSTSDQRYNIIPDLVNLFEFLLTSQSPSPSNLDNDVKSYQGLLTDPNNNDYIQMNHNTWSNENADASKENENAKSFEDGFHQLSSLDCVNGLSDTRLVENSYGNFEFISDSITTPEHVLKCPYDSNEPSSNRSNSQATQLVHNMSDDYVNCQSSLINGICYNIPPTILVQQPSIFNCPMPAAARKFANEEIAVGCVSGENSCAISEKKSCKNFQSFESTNLTFSDIFQNIHSLSRILSSHTNTIDMIAEVPIKSDMIAGENNPVYLNNRPPAHPRKTYNPVERCDRSTTMSSEDSSKEEKDEDGEQAPLKSCKRSSRMTHVSFTDSSNDKCCQVSNEERAAGLKKPNESPESSQEVTKLSLAVKEQNLPPKILVNQSVQANTTIKNQQIPLTPEEESNNGKKCTKKPDSVIMVKCLEPNKPFGDQKFIEEEKQYKDTQCYCDNRHFLELSPREDLDDENEDTNELYETVVSRHCLFSLDDLNNPISVRSPKKEKTHICHNSSTEAASGFQSHNAVNKAHYYGIKKNRKYKRKIRKNADFILEKLNNLNNCIQKKNSEDDYQPFSVDNLSLAKTFSDRDKMDSSCGKFSCCFSSSRKKFPATDFTDSFDTSTDIYCDKSRFCDITHGTLPKKRQSGKVQKQEYSDLLIKAALTPAAMKQIKIDHVANFEEDPLNNTNSPYAKLVRKDSIMESFIDDSAKQSFSNNVYTADKTFAKKPPTKVIERKKVKNKDISLIPIKHISKKHLLNDILQTSKTFADLNAKNETKSTKLDPLLLIQTDSVTGEDKSSYFPITKALNKFTKPPCKEEDIDTSSIRSASNTKLDKTEGAHQDNDSSHSSPAGELAAESLKTFIEHCSKTMLQQRQKKIKPDISTCRAKAVSPIRLVDMKTHQINSINRYSQSKNKNKSCKNNVKTSILETALLKAKHLNLKKAAQNFSNINTNNANDENKNKTHEISKPNSIVDVVTQESKRSPPLYKPLKQTCHLDEEDVWSGETMLMRAVLNRSYQTIENLLLAGCTIDQIDFKGRTAFIISTHLLDSNSAQMLLQHGSVFRDYKIMQIAFARSSQISEFVKILLMVVYSGLNLTKNLNSWEELISRTMDKCLEQFDESNEEGSTYVSRLKCIKQSCREPQSLQTKCILAIRSHLLELNRGRSILSLLSHLQLPRRFIDLLAFNGLSL